MRNNTRYEMSNFSLLRRKFGRAEGGTTLHPNANVRGRGVVADGISIECERGGKSEIKKE